MALKSAPKHCASKFSWQGNSGTSEASTLGYDWLARVDAHVIDPGFILTSPRTGKELVFLIDRTLRNQGGDVMGWVFRERLIGAITVTVFNT